MEITIPYEFKPRPYQLELFKALDSGYKRACVVYHRRAGKDKSLFNLLIKKAFERKGVYYYLFPEFAQGRRVIWDGVDGSGFKFLDHIPEPLIQRKNSTDMKIELVNGSVIQVIGTDKFDKVRGSNPVGCVFSEFAFQNPKAWHIIRPILAENNGWACFNSTPNGKNHFYDMYNMAKDNVRWFTQFLTVNDTYDWDNKPIITEEAIQEEREAGMTEEMIQQEFYCSWIANAQGFYYLSMIEDATKEGRICNLPHDPSSPVETWWDIGVNDNTCIWFTQTFGNKIHIIDFLKASGHGLSYYAKQLQRKPYVYRSHNFPHDIGNTEFGTGRTRIEVAEELFKGTRINVLPKLPVEDGINAVRMVLPSCHFDKRKCHEGLDALRNYRKQFDERLQEYKDKPLHDWASDPSDAFRYMAVGISLPRARSFKNEFMKKSNKIISIKNWQGA
jgi:hypothetical protein